MTAAFAVISHTLWFCPRRHFSSTQLNTNERKTVFSVLLLLLLLFEKWANGFYTNKIISISLIPTFWCTTRFSNQYYMAEWDTFEQYAFQLGKKCWMRQWIIMQSPVCSREAKSQANWRKEIPKQTKKKINQEKIILKENPQTKDAFVDHLYFSFQHNASACACRRNAHTNKYVRHETAAVIFSVAQHSFVHDVFPPAFLILYSDNRIYILMITMFFPTISAHQLTLIAVQLLHNSEQEPNENVLLLLLPHSTALTRNRNWKYCNRQSIDFH